MRKSIIDALQFGLKGFVKPGFDLRCHSIFVEGEDVNGGGGVGIVACTAGMDRLK